MGIDLDLDLDAIEARIATQAATLDAATHALLADIRIWDAENGWAKQGARSCAEWLSWRVGWTGSTAREHLRVARKLGELPAIDAALQRGEVSYCKVRAMTRVATPANEAMLLADAKLTTGAQLDKICRRFASVLHYEQPRSEELDRERRYVRRLPREDGMVKIEAVLHPEEAAVVWAALEATARSLQKVPQPSDKASGRVMPAGEPDTQAQATRMGVSDAPERGTGMGDPGAVAERVAIGNASAEAPRENWRPAFARSFDRANALVAMGEGVLRGERMNRSPVELVITTTRECLAHPDEACGLAVTQDATCIAPLAARRLACDAGVVEMEVDECGTPLDVGRRLRTVSAQLKRALEHRDPTCKFPGCTNHLFTEAHHIEHWVDGGETKLSNLVRMCSFHHRFVHEYGYRIELDRDLVPRFKTPRGTSVSDAPSPSSASALAYRATITAETNACGWDGEPLQYDLIVGGLYRQTMGEIE